MDCADKIFEITERYRPIKRINIETIAHLLPKFVSDKINKEKTNSVQTVQVNFGNEKGITG